MKEVFPELSKLSNEEMCDRWISLGIEFYKEEKTPVGLLTRLTLPFAVIVLIVMIIGLPVNFFITGYWGYNLGSNNKILNWLRSLRIQ